MVCDMLFEFLRTKKNTLGLPFHVAEQCKKMQPEVATYQPTVNYYLSQINQWSCRQQVGSVMFFSLGQSVYRVCKPHSSLLERNHATAEKQISKIINPSKCSSI